MDEPAAGEPVVHEPAEVTEEPIQVAQVQDAETVDPMNTESVAMALPLARPLYRDEPVEERQAEQPVAPEPETVVAQMAASGLGQGVEDSAISVWSMPSGAMVMSHDSFTHPFAGSGLEVHGSEGTPSLTKVAAIELETS